jgi:hypothetical protein
VKTSSRNASPLSPLLSVVSVQDSRAKPSLTAPPQPGCPAADSGIGLLPRYADRISTECR